MEKAFSKQNRALLAELVRTDFKLRYQGSVLGYTWSLLKPLFMFAVLYTVFVKFLRIGTSTPHFPVYLLLGTILWNFFSELTQQSLASVVVRGELIRKIRIPRWLIVVSASVSAVINLSLNLIILLILMIINGVNLRFNAIIFPLSILEIYLFALGISLILSTAYVKYRDVSHIWDVLLQAGFYVIPIVYPLSLIKNELLQKIIILNPLSQSIQDSRYNLVTDQTVTLISVFSGWIYWIIPWIFTALIFILGVLYFKKNAPYFAEEI